MEGDDRTRAIPPIDFHPPPSPSCRTRSVGLDILPPHARVVEWQTRGTQNPVGATP